MRQYILRFAAILIAIALVAFTRPIKKENATNYPYCYFKFIGAFPEETSNPSSWEEITESEYLTTWCTGTRMGCTIKVDQYYTWIVNGQRQIWIQIPVQNSQTSNEAAIADYAVTFEANNKIN